MVQRPRQWRVVCDCPHCGQEMEEIVRLDEEIYTGQLLDVTAFVPTIVHPTSYARCRTCNIRHSTPLLQPVLRLESKPESQ